MFPDTRSEDPVVALKCKLGELTALLHTDAGTLKQVTPLLELLETARDEPKAQVFPTLIKCAGKLVADGNPLWVDPHLLGQDHPLRHHPHGFFGELDRRIDDELGMLAHTKTVPNLIPVLRQSATDAELASVRLLQEHERRPIAVRLRKPREPDLLNAVRGLRRITERVGVDSGELHVIIDEQHVDNADEQLAATDVAVVCSIRDSLSPASVTLLSGSTPRARKDYATRVQARADWQLWATVDHELRLAGGSGLRYGDYGVVHAMPPQTGGQPQAPNPYVHYTTDNRSLFMAKRVPHDQDGNRPDGVRADTFAEVADLLTERPEYAGPGYSWGDREFARCRSNGPRRTGSASDWLAMATSHHLTCIARQRTQPE